MKSLPLLLTLPLLLACSMAGANSFEWLMKETEAPKIETSPRRSVRVIRRRKGQPDLQLA